jgi:serine/threonine protein kinase
MRLFVPQSDPRNFQLYNFAGAAMSIEDRPEDVSRIRMIVEEIVAENPVEPSFSPPEAESVEETRRTRLHQECPDADEFALGAAILQNYSDRERAARLGASSTRQHATPELWLRIPNDDLESGYEPIVDLARGGSAVITLCDSRYLGYTTVVKLLKLSDHALQAGLALKEGQALTDRYHPNIVRIHEVGYMRTPEGDFPYVSMEYVPGTSWRRWLPPAFKKGMGDASKWNRHVAQMIRDLASAIARCHIDQIAHGDISPGNIMVRPDDAVTIIDFGFASVRDTPGTFADTLGYSDPFVPHGDFWSMVRRDVFGLGACLLNGLTGQVPVPPLAEPPLHRGDENPIRRDWDAWLNGLPIDGQLKAIVLKCMKSTVLERYSSVRELEDDLTSWVEDRPMKHCGVRYSLRDRWRMLKTRCRNTEDPMDHSWLMAIMSIVLVGLISSAGVINLAMLAMDFTPKDAFFGSGMFLNTTTLALFAYSLFITKFRRVARSMYMSVASVSVVSILLIAMYAPTPNDLESMSEMRNVAVFIYMAVSMHAIMVGGMLRGWRVLQFTGWAALLLTPGVRVLLTIPWWADRVFIPLAAIEILDCIVFAFSVLTAATFNRSELPGLARS